MKKTIALLVFFKNMERSEREIVNDRFIEEIERAGYNSEILFYNLFSIFFKAGKVEVYYDNKRFKPQKYLCLIVQYYFLNNEFASNMFIVKVLNGLGVKTFNSLESVLLAKNKRETLYSLAKAGLPVIPSGVNFSQFFLDQQLKHFGNHKIVAKTNNGSMGYGVSILESQISFISFMEFVGNIYQPSNILIQPFIKSNNIDHRIFIVGGKVVATMKRQALGIEFRANVSKGGIGVAIKPDRKMAELAVKATKFLGLDYAGVDVIREKNKLMVVEVNSNPGFKIELAAKINVVRAIVKHCIKKS